MVSLSNPFWELSVREGWAIKIAFEYHVGSARTV
jgi:hypothetical protein